MHGVRSRAEAQQAQMPFEVPDPLTPVVPADAVERIGHHGDAGGPHRLHLIGYVLDRHIMGPQTGVRPPPAHARLPAGPSCPRPVERWQAGRGPDG
nr:hypothetical protein GCM10010200_094990 [Actinomadura rugatobispora]